MAVYEHTYRPYRGPRTAGRWRWLVIPRYALGEALRSRIFVLALAASFIWPLAFAAGIYLRHNVAVLEQLGIPPPNLSAVGGEYLQLLMAFQTSMALILAFLVGPGLVSADLANNGLPLYLCRPFSRREYVLGKLAVLAILLSAVTWLPGLALVGLQAVLEGAGWLAGNAWLIGAVLGTSWTAILVFSLLALALSAWVRWKALARGLYLGVFVGLAALGEMINELFSFHAAFRTHDWARLLNVRVLLETTSDQLFRTGARPEVPIWAAWAVLATICCLCLLLLARRVRAYEVVR